MTERAKHLFQFAAHEIANAAKAEGDYHAERVAYWKAELETATEHVKATARVKVDKIQVTGGWQPEVTVDYGDPAAFAQMHRASSRIQRHQTERDRFRSDAELYGTQHDRVYELDAEDVAHFRLNGREREE